jgi:glutathione S-transferase
MAWVDLVAIAALAQFVFFGSLVGAARNRYGVHAPAVTGHEAFERLYRVQMNTLELLVVFLPALFLAARHGSPNLVAAAGGVYLVGRFIYWRAYVADPKRRSLGFGLSILPTLGLLGAAAVGIVRGGF